MKKKLLVLIFLFSFQYSFSQSLMRTGEFIIVNKMETSIGNIKVKVYPIGLIFGSQDFHINSNTKYTPEVNSENYVQNRGFLTGWEKTLIPFVPLSDPDPALLRINQDGTSGASLCDMSAGYGKYQIEILYDYKTGQGWQIIKTFTMDWSDSDYYREYPNGFNADIQVFVFNLNNIKIHYDGSNFPDPTDYHDLSLFNNEIKIWRQYHIYLNGDTILHVKNQNKNNFKTTNDSNNLYLDHWPWKGTDYLNSPNPTNLHSSIGSLFVNLEIQNNHYAKINTAIPFIIEDSAKLKLKYSETYGSNARLYVQNNAEFRVKPTGNLDIDKYGNVILESGGKMYMENNSNILFHDHGEIIINSGGTLCNCGANITNNSSVCIIVHNGGNYFIGSQYCIPSVTHTFNNGAFLVVDEGTLNIGDSSKIIFDGPTSFLKINPNSNIKLGENASIEFKNGAYIKASGGTFTSIDTTKLWEGIILTNSGIDSIVNCTFKKAKTALTFISDTSSSFISRVIKNNTFNIPAGEGNKGIYGVNNFRITIENNVFNMPSNPSSHVFGVYLKSNNTQGSSSVTSVTENETPLSQYSIYILNNSFNNGSASLVLANYTSSYLPVFVKGNYLASASIIGILGRSISGTIRDNRILNYSIPMGMHLVSSSPALYNNTLSTANVSLHTIGSSYPDLSPLIDGTNKIWKAGRNNLSSLNSDNIQLATPGNVHVNLGENKFTRSAEA